MDDLISRRMAIDEAEEWIETYSSERGGQRERDAIKHVISGIKKLPSAQQWIPCSERLPERQTSVLVTDFDAVEMAYINGDGKWMDYFGDKLKAVTAWKPLPEPWKGEEDE